MIFLCSAKGVFFRRNADVDSFTGLPIGDSTASTKLLLPPGGKMQDRIATAIAGLNILEFGFRFFFIGEISVVLCRLIEDIRDIEGLLLVMADRYARGIVYGISLVDVSKSKRNGLL